MATDPQSLLADAKCFMCFGVTQAEAMQLALLKQIAEAGSSAPAANYKIYRATLTQGGAAVPPTVTVLENTLGGVPVWTYIGTGNYRLTLAGAFPNADKVFMLVGNIDAGQPSGAMFLQWVNANIIDLFTYNDTTPPVLIADGCLISNAIQILVYP